MIQPAIQTVILLGTGLLMAGSMDAWQHADTRFPADGLETIAAPVNQVSQDHVDIAPCFTMLISNVDVPAQESGPLVLVAVREGQTVEAGTELARIDDRLGQLRLETAQTKLDAAMEKANSDIDIRAANNALEIADRERRTNYGLFTKGTLPKQEYDRSALQAKQAALQLEQAQRDREAAAREAQVEQYNVRAASESLLRHRIQSPVSGNVLELYKDSGEWVNAGDNVMRVARMDQLYVQGLLDSSLFDPHEVQGQPVTVVARMAHGEQAEFGGRIVFVALEKNSSKYYSIRAQVDNRQQQGHWLLLANEEVNMRIHLDGRPVASQPSQLR